MVVPLRSISIITKEKKSETCCQVLRHQLLRKKILSRKLQASSKSSRSFVHIVHFYLALLVLSRQSPKPYETTLSLGMSCTLEMTVVTSLILETVATRRNTGLENSPILCLKSRKQSKNAIPCNCSLWTVRYMHDIRFFRKNLTPASLFQSPGFHNNYARIMR